MVSKDLYKYKISKSYILNDYNSYICLKFKCQYSHKAYILFYILLLILLLN